MKRSAKKSLEPLLCPTAPEKKYAWLTYTGRVSAAVGDVPSTQDGVGGGTEGLSSFKCTNPVLCVSEGSTVTDCSSFCL